MCGEENGKYTKSEWEVVTPGGKTLNCNKINSSFKPDE